MTEQDDEALQKIFAECDRVEMRNAIGLVIGIMLAVSLLVLATGCSGGRGAIPIVHIPL